MRSGRQNLTCRFARDQLWKFPVAMNALRLDGKIAARRKFVSDRNRPALKRPDQHQLTGQNTNILLRRMPWLSLILSKQRWRARYLRMNRKKLRRQWKEYRRTHPVQRRIYCKK